VSTGGRGLGGGISRDLRRARFAVLAVFFLNGIILANWVVRIPAVSDGLSLSKGTLGLALLGIAVGALLSMPLVGGLVARLGSRPVVGATALLLALAVALPALAPGLPVLVVALVALGAANGALDVSMNAHAVAVEERYGRPIMSSFHAAFSFGGLAGAVIGGLVASLGVGAAPHLLGVAALAAVAAVAAYGALLPAGADRGGAESGPAFALPTKAVAGLGVISFCVLLGEGAMADWSAIYLDDSLGTGPGLAAAGYAAFSLTMAFGRLFGDGLTERFGPAALVRVCGVLATLGLGAALAVGHPVAALVGFACAGAGFSIVFPLALSAAGRVGTMAPGPALAAVATAGYFGFLVGPPSIGFLAELLSLGGALYLVVLLSAAIFLLAPAVARAGKG
jgi:MFS family permease